MSTPSWADELACWKRAESTWDLAMLWIDGPADGHPEEDLIDALRGGIRDALPEVSASAPNLTRVHASGLM